MARITAAAPTATRRRSGSAAPAGPGPGGHEPDDGGDDAGGDERPGDPAAALVAEHDGDERDDQETGRRDEADDRRPRGSRSASRASPPAGQSHSARIAGVAKHRYSANQPACPKVDCSRSAPREVGERIGGAQHAQVEVPQPIEGAGGDGEDEPGEDAAGHLERGVRAAGGRGAPGSRRGPRPPPSARPPRRAA